MTAVRFNVSMGLGLPAALLLGLPAVAYGAALPSADAIIEKVDSLRLPKEDNTRATITITTMGQPGAGSANYEVLTRDGGQRSLVYATGGEQKGQKFLSTPEGYWFYAPRTHRAIRITPLQILRGQASVGDIARLHFALDYSANFASPAEVTIDGIPCLALSLKAKSPVATYASITLWVRKGSLLPQKADLMAHSGRLLKTMQFGDPVPVAGGMMIRSITYIDGVTPSHQTRVDTRSSVPAKTPASQFRAEALSLD